MSALFKSKIWDTHAWNINEKETCDINEESNQERIEALPSIFLGIPFFNLLQRNTYSEIYSFCF